MAEPFIIAENLSYTYQDGEHGNVFTAIDPEGYAAQRRGAAALAVLIGIG